MAKTEEAKKIVEIIEVVHHGDALIVPDKITLQAAKEAIERQIKYEDETVIIREEIDTFLWDGAYAMTKAMAKLFGFASAEAKKSWFGDQPPALISVEIGYKKTVHVPWGQFTLPGITGYVETQWAQKNGKFIFCLQARVLRKHERQIAELAAKTREILATESLYRGKAIQMRFKSDDGDIIPLPMPAFIDTASIVEAELILPREVESSLRINLFTLIEHSARCRLRGTPLKRGVLLAGPYGTGKTLAASITAKKCDRHGWTFILCERANELPETLRFAAQYQPAVVFCEDIDRVVQGERDIEMDEILNIIDGIGSKAVEVCTVLTTNNVAEIHQAMLRPGRLDAVINVLPPDREAVERLIRLYARGCVAEEEDLSAVGRELAGKIPAIVREVVERAKLAAIATLSEDFNDQTDTFELTADHLMSAALSMINQNRLLEPKVEDKRSDIEKAAEALGQSLKEALAFPLPSLQSSRSNERLLVRAAGE